MRLTHHQTWDASEHVYTFTFTEYEYKRAALKPFDRKLITEVGDEGKSIADFLLALELIARRIEEGVHRG